MSVIATKTNPCPSPRFNPILYRNRLSGLAVKTKNRNRQTVTFEFILLSMNSKPKLHKICVNQNTDLQIKSITITVTCGIITHRATPFCTTTFPECKCLKGGKPFSFRNNNPSSIWRPNLATCHAGRPVPTDPYLRLYSSFHVLWWK